MDLLGKVEHNSVHATVSVPRDNNTEIRGDQWGSPSIKYEMDDARIIGEISFDVTRGRVVEELDVARDRVSGRDWCAGAEHLDFKLIFGIFDHVKRTVIPSTTDSQQDAVQDRIVSEGWDSSCRRR